MDLLARREQSAKELFTKLKRRSDDDDLIQSVITQLQEDALQCDRRFSESFFRSLVNRGIGPIRIRNEFRTKGISADLVDEIFQEMTDSVNWFDIAEAIVTKKFGSLEFSDEKNKAKCLRFLAYRGFSNEIAYEIIF
ncbi:regulatory protein RecX [uncultured Umboniibacter sp.]|uniref:regulatory protein RecX n=1 Tax=uncultured Umboniibacter sp. TaxID=1798917 RepID=UPI00262D45DE|nr:regulatory protein RecX [uncultured Umboniibacter sp.]